MVKVLNKNRILIFILFAAFLLRFIGTFPGYNHYHSDEPIIYGTAIDMVKNNSLDPIRFDYPSTSMYINFFFFKFIFIPLSWAAYYIFHIFDIIDGTIHIPISDLQKDILFHTVILGKGEIYPMFWGRYITALFSLGSVFLTYLVGKKLFSKSVGLISALLLAFDFKTIVNSHIGLPDIYNSFFLLLAILGAVYLWKKPTFRNYLLAGAAAGLAFSVKYQFFGILPLFVVFLYIPFKPKRILLALFCIPLVFLVTNPYFLIHIETALMWIKDVSLKYGMGTRQLNFFPISYLYHVDFGIVEFLVVLVGMFFASLRFFRRSMIFLPIIFLFGFLFVYYSNGGFYVRNLLTITPILFIFGAVLIAQFFDFVKKLRYI